jgi:hypothetical protein
MRQLLLLTTVWVTACSPDSAPLTSRTESSEIRGGTDVLFTDHFRQRHRNGLGPRWEVVSGSWHTDGRAVSDDDGGDRATARVQCGDCAVAADVIGSGATETSLFVRAPSLSSSDGYEVVLRDDGDLQILRVAGGFSSLLARGPSEIGALDEPATIGLQATGSGPVVLIARVNGARHLVVTDSAAGALLAPGWSGMRASDAGAVFDDFVLRQAVAPDCAPTHLADGTHIPGPIAVTGDFLYWADTRSAFASLHRMPRAGGPAEALAPVPGVGSNADVIRIVDLIVDELGVYWLLQLNSHGVPTSFLYRFSFADGSTQTLARGTNMQSLVRDGDTLYFTDVDGLSAIARTGGSPTHIADTPNGRIADARESLYVLGGGRIVRVRKTTGATTELVQGLTDPPVDIAAGRAGIFFIDGSSRLQTLDENGAPVVLHAAVSPFGFGFGRGRLLAVARDTVYFASEVGLARIHDDGSRFVPIGPGPTGIAVDATDVYFSDDDEVGFLCR